MTITLHVGKVLLLGTCLKIILETRSFWKIMLSEKLCFSRLTMHHSVTYVVDTQSMDFLCNLVGIDKLVRGFVRDRMNLVRRLHQKYKDWRISDLCIPNWTDNRHYWRILVWLVAFVRPALQKKLSMRNWNAMKLIWNGFDTYHCYIRYEDFRRNEVDRYIQNDGSQHYKSHSNHKGRSCKLLCNFL